MTVDTGHRTPHHITTTVEWKPAAGADALREHASTLTRVITHELTTLETGTHLLTLGSVQFILWVDHEDAYGDNGKPAPGWTVTEFDLRHVVGQNPHRDHVRVSRETASPYRPTGSRAPLFDAAARTAHHLTVHATRYAD